MVVFAMLSRGLTSVEAFGRFRNLVSGQRRQSRASLIVPLKAKRRIDLLWYSRALLCFLSFCIGLAIDGDQMRTPGNILIPLVVLLLVAFSSVLIFESQNYSPHFASSWRSQILDELESYTAVKKQAGTVPCCLQSDTQLVIRDGQLVQIPVLLLVNGDIALLKHGQYIQFRCRVQRLEGVTEEIKPGSIFSKDLKPNPSNFTLTARQDHFEQLTEALVTEAPILEFITYSDKHSHTGETQPAFILFVSILTTLSDVIWICLGIILISAVLARVYKSSGSVNYLAASWISLIVGKFIFYSSGFTFWLLWRVAVMFTFVRFHTVEFRLTDHLSAVDCASGRSFDSHSEETEAGERRRFGNRLWINIPLWVARLKQTCSELKQLNLFELDNTVLTLGSVNSVCCVQQYGILSRTRLTPEKIFFFHKQHHHHHHHAHLDPKSPLSTGSPEVTIAGQSSRPELCLNLPAFALDTVHETNEHLLSPMDSRRDRIGSVCSDLDEHNLVPGDRKRPIVPVILNLRTDSYWPCLPHFEKPKWAHYLASLKPIGLALLLNNAHALAKPRRNFSDHIASLHSRSNVSVQCQLDPLLSCQCYLAREIGFTEGAVRGFTCCGSLGAYSISSSGAWNEHSKSPNEDQSVNSVPQTHVLQRERFAELKDPRDLCTVEHSFSAIFTHPTAHDEYQLMTQATGDMLVTLCSDVWDGRGISPLSESERDALLDFYHRNASAAYCVGFAYTPLLFRLPSSWGDNVGGFDASGEDPIILELPKWKPTDWVEDTHSTSGTHGHNDQFVVSRPASARLPDTTPLFNGSLLGRSVVHQSIPLDGERPRSGFATPRVRSPPLRETTLLFPTRLATSTQCTEGDQSSVDLIASISAKPKRVVPVHLNNNNNSAKRFVGLTRSSSGDFVSVPKLKQTEAYQSAFPDPSLNRVSADKIKSTQSRAEGDELLTLLDDQIFLGLISMQYQVRPDVVEAIKQLDEACIRFVYFSRENELRSRVFAERLGLEYGWNCHISLANPSEQRRSISAHATLARDASHTNRDSLEDNSVIPTPIFNSRQSGLFMNEQPNPNPHLHRFGSDPTIMKNQGTRSPDGHWAFEQTNNPNSKLPQHHEILRRHSAPYLVAETTYEQFEISPYVAKSTETLRPQNNSSSSLSPSSSSSSTSTSSVHPDTEGHSDGYCGPRLSYYVTENKSRLPCGIDHIRPHLQNVDNVPLQVSLFTDCSTASIREMIRIRQEYGEIVCVVGSTYSVDSLRLMQCADVAVAIQPELPKPCNAFTADCDDKKHTDPIRPTTHDHRDSGFTHAQPTTRSDEVILENIPLNTLVETAQTKSVADLIHELDLTARLVCSLSPQILNLNRSGFYVYELIREAHASVSNLFFSVAFYWLAPVPFILVQLLLLMLGLPTMPFQMWTVPKLNANSSSVAETTLWLPPCWLRTHLIPFSDTLLLDSSDVHDNFSAPAEMRTIALAHMSSNIPCLVPEFGAGQWLWFVLLVIPLLSLSMLDRRVERNRPLREPPVKRGKWLTKRKIFRVGLITTARLLPSILVCVLSVMGLLWWAPGFEQCTELESLCTYDAPNRTVELLEVNPARRRYDPAVQTCSARDRNEFYHTCFGRLAMLVGLVKDFAFSQLIYYLVLISMTYANFGQSIRKFRWSTNPSWCISIVVILFAQTSWFLLHGLHLNELLRDRPIHVLHSGIVAAGVMWCPILIILNEAISWKERRLIHTEHRLARLYFRTKLGMYSPV